MIDEDAFIARIVTVFREELDQPQLKIGMHTVREEVSNWDSLAHVRLVIGVERAFDVQFDVSEIETIDSVRGFYEAACRHSK